MQIPIHNSGRNGGNKSDMNHLDDTVAASHQTL